MRTNLFAWTDPDPSYPQFVSLNREEDGRTTLTVRSPGFWKETKDKPLLRMVGNEGCAAMPRAGLRALRDALNKELGE